MDFERDICPKPLKSNALEKTDQKGLFMVPHRHTFSESVQVCKTLSGSLTSYVTQNEFEDLTYFLSLSQNMKAVNCVDTAEGSTKIKVWAGGQDEIKEGIWETWKQRQLVEVTFLISINQKLISILQHLPWADSRPYDNGVRYNCLVIEGQMIDQGKPHYEQQQINVIDEVRTKNPFSFFIIEFH